MIASPVLPVLLDLPPAVSGLSPDALLRVVRAVARDEASWVPLLRSGSPERRWWRRLHAGPDLDVWLLAWLPGHATDLHDHGDSAAAYTVVRGSLSDVRADSAGRVRTRDLPAGWGTSMPAGAVHDVRATAPAVSIHAYSRPLTRMTYYALSAGRLEPVRVVDTDEPEEAA